MDLKEVGGLTFGRYHETAIGVKEQLVNRRQRNILICGHIREPLHSDRKYENNEKTLVLILYCSQKSYHAEYQVLEPFFKMNFDITLINLQFLHLNLPCIDV
jgi:hypothetical protein